ncbi:MAG: ribosome biogenesis GTPase Der [Bacteroidales bacterium]
MGNILAIVGRPNVGKSTFFNRLTGTRQAIVDPTSGVTRDRHYGKSDWNGIEFSVIDTGGFVVGGDDEFEEAIRRQVQLAIDEADVITFLVDVTEGPTPMDKDVAQLIRKSGKKAFLVANKVDHSGLIGAASEFYSFGLGEVWCISSMNGSGTGDLLDEIVPLFAKTEEEEDALDLPKIAVVGRPNVGKSSFVNALLGDERNIVTSIAGTTRDSIYTRFKSFGFDFLLIDTAGLRKKGKVFENVEFYSTMRSVRAIENCDVCFVIVDATTGFEAQDLNIFSLAEKNHKGIVIIVNKWDLVEKETNTHKEFEDKIRQKIAPFSDVPIVFTSVLTKQRIFKALELAIQVYENRRKHIPTGELNETMLPIILDHPVPATKGKYVKVKYITQIKTPYPSFVFFCNLPQYVKEPYKRFIENQLRKIYNFEGAPMEIYFRQK